MKKLLISILICFSVQIVTAETNDNACNSTTNCITSDNFNADIAKISKRGETLIAQSRFMSKMNYDNFRVDFKDGYALLLDANGNEFKVDGKNITGFALRHGEVRVISLRFKGTKDKPITEPFDLTIKASPLVGEITFFDLMYSK